VTFGHFLWAPIMLRSRLDPFGMTHRDMARLLDEAELLRGSPEQARRCEDFLTEVVAQSFEGLISDPANNPECLEPNNVEQVARASLMTMAIDRNKNLALGQATR
jgi:hypothetical protein